MKESTNDDNVTFYDVPLVCDAAPKIGCGSRIKRLLIDLERQVAIEAAWINRAGTIVAIVWSAPAHGAEVAKLIFEKHEVQYRKRRGDEPTSFRTEGSWFRGAEVDLLSMEEAREIAETSVSAAKREKLVSVEDAARIESNIESYFREELVKLRTKQELLLDTQSKFRQAVLDIYRKHIGTERTAQVVRAHGIQDPFNRPDRKETVSCCA